MPCYGGTNAGVNLSVNAAVAAVNAVVVNDARVGFQLAVNAGRQFVDLRVLLSGFLSG
jgi:hypothetical protein